MLPSHPMFPCYFLQFSLLPFICSFYLTTFPLDYTSSYSLAIDLCTLLVFKQPVLIVSSQFENQPFQPFHPFQPFDLADLVDLVQFLPLFSYLVTPLTTLSHPYVYTSEIRTPSSKNEGATHKLKPSPGSSLHFPHGHLLHP